MNIEVSIPDSKEMLFIRVTNDAPLSNTDVCAILEYLLKQFKGDTNEQQSADQVDSNATRQSGTIDPDVIRDGNETA